MRLVGIFLTVLGIVALGAGVFAGCGTLFSWNGRHAVEARPLPVGESKHSVVPVMGRRYTLAVQVVFDRQGLPERDGALEVEAQLPLIVRVKDQSGTTLAESVGWFDPNEPPTVLYGQALSRENRAHHAELFAERLVGPFGSAGSAPLDVTVDLGADRAGSAKILERRLVVYDDALPGSIRLALVAAVAGGLAATVGFVLLVIAFFRRRGQRRGGIRKRHVV